MINFKFITSKIFLKVNAKFLLPIHCNLTIYCKTCKIFFNMISNNFEIFFCIFDVVQHFHDMVQYWLRSEIFSQYVQYSQKLYKIFTILLYIPWCCATFSQCGSIFALIWNIFNIRKIGRNFHNTARYSVMLCNVFTILFKIRGYLQSFLNIV